MKKVFSFEEELCSIDNAISVVEQLKPSAVSRIIDVVFCKMYAIAIAKMLNDLRIKGINESDENNIYFFDKKRSNRFCNLKNAHLIGIGFRRHKKDSKDPFGNDLVKYNGYYYEFLYYHEDGFPTSNGWKGFLNCGILQAMGIRTWRDVYNCLRIERNYKNNIKTSRQ